MSVGGHGWLIGWRAHHKILFVSRGRLLAALPDHDGSDNTHTDDSQGDAAGDDETLAMSGEVLPGEGVTIRETSEN